MGRERCSVGQCPKSQWPPPNGVWHRPHREPIRNGRCKLFIPRDDESYFVSATAKIAFPRRWDGSGGWLPCHCSPQHVILKDVTNSEQTGAQQVSASQTTEAVRN